MIEIIPKDDHYNFGYLFSATLFCLVVMGFILYSNRQIEKKVAAVAKSQLATGKFLNDYVVEVEARFEQIADQIELAETIVPIYERRLSEIENWKEGKYRETSKR